MSHERRPTRPNQIGAEILPTRRGAFFEAGGESWPRSGPEDVAAALAALRSPVTVIQRSWCEGIRPLELLLARELAAGHSLLLLGDRRDPLPAWKAWQAISPPAGRAALLSSDAEGLLAAALRDPRVERVLLSGHTGDRERWAPLLAHARARVSLEPLETAHRNVEPGADPVRAAEAVLAHAFGREETHSGQLAGQLGRVRVEPRLLSRFTAALLEGLARGAELTPPLDPPLGPVEADLPAYLEMAGRLALEEGATAIHERRDGSPRGRAGARIVRLVFTNVEPRMRVWNLTRPAPLLLISRLQARNRT